MSKNKYEVRRDFLPVRTALEDLSPELSRAVEEALRVLEDDPRPERYGWQEVKDACFKITVEGSGENIAILYEVRDSPARVIDLINVKRVGAIRRKLKWLADLKDFRP
jgi:hypothetical protein